MTITLTFETTGEVRRPRRGEWFANMSGKPKLAELNYACAEFPILRAVENPDVVTVTRSVFASVLDGLTNLATTYEGKYTGAVAERMRQALLGVMKPLQE